MKILSKQEILDSEDMKNTLLEVPEWGGSVYIKAFTIRQKEIFERGVTDKKGNRKNVNVAALLCQMTIVDEEGNLLFSDDDISDLKRKSAMAMTRVFDEAARLNGFTKEDVEELEKNSETVQSDNSASD